MDVTPDVTDPAPWACVVETGRFEEVQVKGSRLGKQKKIGRKKWKEEAFHKIDRKTLQKVTKDLGSTRRRGTKLKTREMELPLFIPVDLSMNLASCIFVSG